MVLLERMVQSKSRSQRFHVNATCFSDLNYFLGPSERLQAVLKAGLGRLV